MINWTAFFIGVATFFECKCHECQLEPMAYESRADYHYWRLFMYDHFER